MPDSNVNHLAVAALFAQGSISALLQNHILNAAQHAETNSATPATAFFTTELLKCCVAVVFVILGAFEPSSPELLLGDEKGTTVAYPDGSMPKLGMTLCALRRARSSVFSSDGWKLAVPVCLSVIQISFQTVAVANVDLKSLSYVSALQCLTVAGGSIVVLKRRLGQRQWTALGLFTVGLALVQSESSTSQPNSTPEPPPHPVPGVVAAAGACVAGALAAVYFEKALKSVRSPGVWVRQLQLSLFSLLPALLRAFHPTFAAVALSSMQPLHLGVGASPAISHLSGLCGWTLIIVNVAGAFLIAFVSKHMDSITASLAAALAIAAYAASSGGRLTPSLAVGAVTLVGATTLYASSSRSGRPHSFGSLHWSSKQQLRPLTLVPPPPYEQQVQWSSRPTVSQRAPGPPAWWGLATDAQRLAVYHRCPASQDPGFGGVWPKASEPLLVTKREGKVVEPAEWGLGVEMRVIDGAGERGAGKETWVSLDSV